MSTQTVKETEPPYGPAAEHAAMIKEILVAGVSRVSGYVAYVHPKVEWWCAEVTVPTERPRSVRIAKTVIENPGTDWNHLHRELAAMASAQFKTSAGCIVSVDGDTASRSQFCIRVGRPYSEDLRPRTPPPQQPQHKASRR